MPLNKIDDPRLVGGVYTSGYWRTDYEVLSVEVIDGLPWWTVRWSDGHETTHCTRWDARRDKIVSQPLPYHV